MSTEVAGATVVPMQQLATLRRIAIVPAFNEERNIGRVLDEVQDVLSSLVLRLLALTIGCVALAGLRNQRIRAVVGGQQVAADDLRRKNPGSSRRLEDKIGRSPRGDPHGLFVELQAIAEATHPALDRLGREVGDSDEGARPSRAADRPAHPDLNDRLVVATAADWNGASSS